MFFPDMSRFSPCLALQLLMDCAIGPDCHLCTAPAAALVCAECARDLPRLPPGSRTPLAAFAYRFPVDRLVQRFKFGGDLAVGRWLAEALAERVAGEPRPDLIVAPPLSRARLHERGFNQSLELARIVGRRLHVPRDPHALVKLRDTVPQQGLGRRARRRNLRGAFHCPQDLRGRRVALVDDVYTTGATAGELARVLRRAGATEVVVWTVARAAARGG